MANEREIIRRLLDVCVDYETELNVAHRVIAGLRLAYPDLPAKEALDAVRAMSVDREAAEAKYKRFFDHLDQADLKNFLGSFPAPKYQN